MTMRNFFSASVAATVAASLGAAVALAPTSAHAQVAAAIGTPLPVSSDPAGQITVRVVDGDPSVPAAGLEITLEVGGTPRVARTDASGRVTFTQVPAGASALVKVPGKSEEQASRPFSVPPSGGVRLLMSTTGGFAGQAPAGQAAAAGEPAAGGAGMPSPRQRSGQPIAWPGSAPDTLAITLTYDDAADPSPPAKHGVYLVSYDVDEKVAVTRLETDDKGKVVFSGLDVSGATSYFAMTILPRGALFDRLLAGPVVLPGGDAGLAMTLSAEKRYSTAAALDDAATLQGLEGAPAPSGQVIVDMQGAAEQSGAVKLYDAATGQELASGAVGPGAPDASQVSAPSMFQVRPDTPAGSVDVVVLDPDGEPMADLEVAVMPEAVYLSSNAVGNVATTKTSAAGPVRVANLPAGKLVAVLRISGQKLRSEPFEVAAQGGVVGFQARWPRVWPRAVLDVTAQPAGKVVYAQSEIGGKRYTSLPFQLAPDRGARASIVVMPRVMFNFSLTSVFEEDYFAFRGRLALRNSSWFPYRQDENGILLPLPRGFKGAQVSEEDARDVSPVPGQGLRFLRPLSSGVRSIVAGWSVPAAGGAVQWDLALPFGAFQSGMEIMQYPGMTVDLPPGVQGETAKVAKGAFFVLPNITILPNQRMVMTIRGLPAQAAWKTYGPRVVGVLVVVLLLGGIAVAMLGPKAAAAEDKSQEQARAAKIEALLEELVALDASETERKEALLAELEGLWPKDADGKASPRAAS